MSLEDELQNLIEKLDDEKPVTGHVVASFIRKARSAIKQLKRDSSEVLSATVLPYAVGGWVVRLLWLPQGYPGGREVEPGLWHFERVEDAIGAVKRCGAQIQKNREQNA